MNLKEAIIEYEMNYIDCLEASTPIKELSAQDEVYSELAEEVFKQLLNKGYVRKNYFISFDKKIIEEEDDAFGIEAGHNPYIWIVLCTATIYEEILF